MFTFLVVLYVVVCLFLILVVLVQQGRGADLAGAFGGGSQQTFGPRGATTFLHKLTTGFFITFIVLAILLAVVESRPSTSVIKEGPRNPKAAPAAPKRPASFPVPAPAPAPATGTTTSAPATTK